MNDTDVIACADDTTGAIPSAAGGKSSPSIQSRRAAILRFILTESQPASLPRAWAILRPVDVVRQLSVPRSDFCALLQRSFADDDLLTTRVCVRRDHDLALSPVFGGDGEKFFVQHDADNLPVDVHGECGALSHAGPAMMWWGTAGQNSHNRPKAAILVESLDDLHVLCALKFTAIISANLTSLSTADLRKLFPDNPVDDGSYGFHLIIADWNVAATSDERRPRARQIVWRLAQAQRLYGLDPGRRFTLWRPENTVRRSLRAAASFKDGKMLRQILRESLPQPTLDLVWHQEIEPNTLSLSTARMRLHRALQQSGHFPRVADVADALEQYLAAYDHTVLAKLHAAADVAIAPGEMLSNLAVAELAERWIHGQPLVAAANEVIAGNHPAAAHAADSARLSERLKLLTALNKAVQNLLPKR